MNIFNHRFCFLNIILLLKNFRFLGVRVDSRACVGKIQDKPGHLVMPENKQMLKQKLWEYIKRI